MYYLLSFLIASLFIGCQPTSTQTDGHKLNVLVTTTLIADLVTHIGQDRIEVKALMGPDVDPHLYKPSALYLNKIKKADIIFFHGLHLEGRMTDLFDQWQAQGQAAYAITQDIPRDKLLYSAESSTQADPHVWFDPQLWSICLDTVATILSAKDPQQADFYQANKETMRIAYHHLDAWMKQQAQRLPQQKRILITSHDAFNYFGRAYDFQVIGVQGISTVTQAGLADITQTIDFIKQQKIPSIFVETSVSESVIKRIAEDSGCRIGGHLYSDALAALGTIEHTPSAEGYDVGTYTGMMQYNMSTIVHALSNSYIDI